MFYVVIVSVILCFLFKFLNVNSSPEKSLFYCANGKFLEEILKNTPSIRDPYFPTRLWGFSGHVQTIIQGVVSRIVYPLVSGKRYFFRQPDEATITYDLYQPIEQHTLGADYTLLICPGICNTSESVYIRRVVFQAQMQGYRVAVLNHVGALKCVPLTAPRIFTYGNTDDYDGMVHEMSKRFPGSKFILVGFSMGGNLITKYLGEKRTRPNNIIAGISACQGYDADKVANHMLQWENFRRLYLFAMTENMRGLLRQWQTELFPEAFKREKGINEKAIWSAATLVELDDAYTRKVENADTVEEMYRKASCVHYFDGVKVPMVFINSADDPVVPKSLTNIIKEAVKTHDNFLYIEQKFGGHLGFYEGGIFCPNPVSWLDKMVVNLADSLSIYTDSGKVDAAREMEEKCLSKIFESEPTTPVKFSQSVPNSCGEEEDDDTMDNSVPSTPKLVIKMRIKRKGPGYVCKRQRMSNKSRVKLGERIVL